MAGNSWTEPGTGLKEFSRKIKEKLPDRLQPAIDENIDEMLMTSRFLSDQKGLAAREVEKLQDATKSVERLQAGLIETNRLKRLIQERAKELSGLGFVKESKLLKEKAYYYGEKIREYRELLKNKKRIVGKALEVVRKMPAYQDFLTRNSAVAGLFNLGSNFNAQRSVEGLQVRTVVEAFVAQRIGTAPGAAQVVGSQLNEARSRFDEFKVKFPQLNNAGEMPDFKPKPLKAKTVLQRLEFGSNIQFQKSSRYFPTTTDIAGQIGYKFHKNGVAGIGVAYKLGMGTGWDNISFSHRGFGFRSFIDWKLKGSFFLSGGYERNRTSAFRNLEELKNWKGWQQSGLVGISKKYKKQSIIILYDILAVRQLPQADKVKVRFGRNF